MCGQTCVVIPPFPVRARSTSPTTRVHQPLPLPRFINHYEVGQRRVEELSKFKDFQKLLAAKANDPATGGP